MSTNTILAFGFHNQAAPRHTNIVKTLQKEGKSVVECHTDKCGFFPKVRDLRTKYREKKAEIDAVLVTFPGHHLVPVAWLMTRFPRKKLLFDAFISVSDTLVSDRKKVSWMNPIAWLFYCVDFVSCHLADQVWIDTEAHKKFFMKRFFLREDRIRVFELGTRNDLFFAKPTMQKNERPTVFFYGSYIPLQGIEHILDAAEIVQNQRSDIQFQLVGSGQTFSTMQKKADNMQLRNVNFQKSVPLETLPDMIRTADVCLGIFGTSDKASRVIPHKVYDAVACGVPVISRESPAMNEKYADGKEVILCKAGDASDLAAKILATINDLRHSEDNS